MDINLLDTDENKFINYINLELLKGRSMKDIEINDFKVNDRVLVKRLGRRGYKRIDNDLNITDEKGKLIKIFNINDNSKETIIQNKQTDEGSTIVDKDKNKQYDKGSSIAILDKDIEIKENILKSNDIIELINRKEEIFKMLDFFKNMSGKMGDALSDNINDNPNGITISLPNPKNNQFKATIRLNDVIWEQFKEFTKKYPFFTTKDLVSQALVDFMNKHSKQS
ncbi:hypothetical protein [Clostridium tertium]|jgi:hypothetical protein|uniref:hypothetical protein n=1 Tax=Clostridium tertium TaxID=1559 RepID=UPI0023B338DB|nr:hypothetical protein [Clostridium tertium]